MKPNEKLSEALKELRSLPRRILQSKPVRRLKESKPVRRTLQSRPVRFVKERVLPRFRNGSTLARREAISGWLYAALPLAGFLVFFVAPFGISIVRSFQRGLTQEFVGFENYRDILESSAFRVAAGNTLRFMVLAVPLNVAIGLIIALGLFRLGSRGTAFRTAFLIPYVIPVSATVMFFQILFERSGVVNTFLWLTGHDPVSFLDSGNALYILVILYLWKNFGYNMVLFLSGLARIPRDYGEAARIDGAGSFRVFWYITMPLLGPTFFFVLIISIANSFKVFREAYALGGDYPHESIYMLQHFMNNNLQNLNYQRVSVASLYVFLVIVGLVLLLYLRRRREGDYRL